MCVCVCEKRNDLYSRNRETDRERATGVESERMEHPGADVDLDLVLSSLAALWGDPFRGASARVTDPS